MALLLLLVLVVTAVCGCNRQRVQTSPLGCRDQHGAAVDWYVLYKLPVLHNTGAQFVGDGVGYMHFSSASAGEQWTLSGVSINDPLSASGRTLKPVYDDPERDSLIYAFYNDANPDGSTPRDKGHTKGVVAFDGHSGFWLIHSVPKFPPPPGEQYSYPSSGHRNGQSFLCVTLPSDQLETVAQQLLFNEPQLYATQMSSSLKSQYPLMARVIAGERRTATPWSGVKPLPISGGVAFASFAKARNFGDDLYSGLVAPYLQTGLYTQTWRVGAGGKLPSYCSTPHHVLNIQDVKATATLPTSGQVTFEFRSTKDHSKWAVSENERNPWVCVGDINRMTPQYNRGGGTVCHHSTTLWKLYSRMVAQVEPCP